MLIRRDAMDVVLWTIITSDHGGIMKEHCPGEETATSAGGHPVPSHDRVRAAVHTIACKMHHLPEGAAPHTPEVQTVGWASSQVHHLLGHLGRQVHTIERVMPQVQDPELRAALDVVLADAATRCGTLARDLDLARGETLGEPEREWTAHVKEGQGVATPAT